MPLRRGELDAADIRLGEGVVGGVAVGSELVWSRPGVMAYAEPDGLVFREGVQAMPSTFTRASQAWDGSGLVAPDTMRVFGRDTKSPVALIEGQRANLFLNSGAPVEQTFAGTGDRTVSMHGTGSLQLSGDSDAVVTEGNPVTVTLSNTLTVTPVGNVQWAQVEEAPSASSYIPTDGAPATRAGEDWDVDGAASLMNGGEFTAHIAELGSENRGRALFGAGNSEVSHSDFLLSLTRQAQPNVGRLRLYHEGVGLTDILFIDVDPTSRNAISLTVTGGTLRMFVNGELRLTSEGFAPERLFDKLVIGVYNYSFRAWTAFIPLAPGAAALGIPFVDNRAWSAEEIQAAHARWLPELNKIEVPV